MPHPLEHSPADRSLEGGEVARIAEAMSALAAESRVRLLYALLEHERTVEELAATVAMEPSAVSQQLRVLRQLRFVRAAREGRRMRYRLHDDHVAELLVAVRHHQEHTAQGWASPARRRRQKASARSERSARS